MLKGRFTERGVPRFGRVAILALTGVSCFFMGLSLGLYLARPGEPLPATPEGTVETPAAEPTVEDTPEPTSTPSPVPTLAPTPMPGRIRAQVVKVIDGASIEVEIEGQIFKVRSNGIDAPELGQPCADEATAKNIELVSGQRVSLVKDVSEVDKYGRLLRYVYVEDLLVNAEMVRQGYAVAFTYAPDVAHADEFVILEAEARQAGRGCWALVATVAPQEISLFVAPDCSQFDAPGNDNDNKSQEWVCFMNGGAQPVEMKGWTVKDEYGWPIPFRLSPWSREGRRDCIPDVARRPQLLYTGAKKGTLSGRTTAILYSFSTGVEAGSVNTVTDERRRVVEGVIECEISSFKRSSFAFASPA